MANNDNTLFYLIMNSETKKEFDALIEQEYWKQLRCFKSEENKDMGFKNQIALEIEAMLESFEKEICLHKDCYGMCYPIQNLKDKEAIMNCMDSHSFLDLWKNSQNMNE